MSKLKLLGLALIGLTGVSQGLWAAPPSSTQVIQWLTNLDESSADPKRAINIRETQQVTLYSGETAYVSAVSFENAARNFWAGYILTRPNLKQSKILEFGGQSNTFAIHPIYLKDKKRGMDLVEFESAGSGQGAVESSKNMTYIQNWTAKTLHEVNAGSYEGRFNDALGDVDCRSGYDNYAYLNVIDEGQYILETTVESNMCENKKPQNYKINTKLVPVEIP